MANPLQALADSQNLSIRDANPDAPRLYENASNSLVQDSETKAFFALFIPIILNQVIFSFRR